MMSRHFRIFLPVVVVLGYLSAEAATNTVSITSPGTKVYPNTGQPAAGSQIN